MHISETQCSTVAPGFYFYQDYASCIGWACVARGCTAPCEGIELLRSITYFIEYAPTLAPTPTPTPTPTPPPACNNPVSIVTKVDNQGLSMLIII